jgi:transketolase
MRLMPNLTVVAPADPVEARAAAAALVAHPGPCYLRLGKAGEPTLHDGPIDFRLGRAILVRAGSDLTLVSTGGMLKAALGVAGRLAERGVEARVLSMHTLKPLDEAAVLAAARETGAILTLEQHSVLGGLGGAVAELLVESGKAVRFRRVGVPSAFPAAVGSQDWLERRHGLDEESIVPVALELLGR